MDGHIRTCQYIYQIISNQKIISTYKNILKHFFFLHWNYVEVINSKEILFDLKSLCSYRPAVGCLLTKLVCLSFLFSINLIAWGAGGGGVSTPLNPLSSSGPRNKLLTPFPLNAMSQAGGKNIGTKWSFDKRLVLF